MPTPTELTNFKMPRDLKRAFKARCRARNQQMTSVLIQLICQFLRDNPVIESPIEEPVSFFINDGFE